MSTIWARAAVFCLDQYDQYEHLNCGTGTEVSIGALAEIVARTVGYHGKIVFDATKPDGTPRKVMDSSRIAALGWKPEISLEEGIASTYRWYVLTLQRQRRWPGRAISAGQDPGRQNCTHSALDGRIGLPIRARPTGSHQSTRAAQWPSRGKAKQSPRTALSGTIGRSQ
jgi:hypothetical protein